MVAPGPPAARRRATAVPAFFFLAAFAATALIIIYLDQPVISLAAVILAAPLGGLAVARLLLARKSRPLTLALCGAALGLLVGGVQGRAGDLERAASHAGLPLAGAGEFRMVLTTDSVLAKNGVRVYSGDLLAAASASGDAAAEAGGRALVFAPDGPPLYWGEVLEAEGSIKRSAEPGGADFIISARGRGVRRIDAGHPLLALRREALTVLLAQIQKLGAPASSLFEALWLGVKDNLEFELRDAFARTGSLHLLALSGLNVGMVAALLLFFLAPLRSKRLKAALAAGLVAVYFFLAGPEPSLVRAVLMLALGTAGLLADREVDPLHILFASAALVIVFDPESTRSLSFQLSYLALFGVLTFGRRIDSLLVPVLPAFARPLIAASFAAQVFTAPLLLARSGAVYPVGIIVSLLLIPLTTLYLWSGAGCLALSLIPFPPLGEALRWAMGMQYRLIFAISDFFKNAPALTVAWQDWFWLPALVLGLLLALGNPIKKVHELRFAH